MDPQAALAVEEELGGRSTYRTNYGSRVVGPWVVGMYKSASEVGFFIVAGRKGVTLRDFIRRNCEQGGHITTDEWAGYRRLSEDGYLHSTVNHSRWL